MPILSDSNFNPSKFWGDGHVQTIYPYFFRKVKDVQYERKRIKTHDNDFIDIDESSTGSNHLIILTHGLEGSTDTSYIRGMTKMLTSQGYDVISWNMRSCSGELNLHGHFYHAASTEDLNDVVQYARNLKVNKKRKYTNISFIAFSLGGNLLAYYLGEQGKKIFSEATSAVIFSTPFGLADTIDHLGSSGMGQIYTGNFLWTMKKKVIGKHRKGLIDICIKDIKSISSFREFDDKYTAPLHGFKSAEDYYSNATATKLIEKIQIPTLVVSAANDPFINSECYPIKEAGKSKNVFLEIPSSGGHCGFGYFEKGWKYWSEERALGWIKKAEKCENKKSQTAQK